MRFKLAVMALVVAGAVVAPSSAQACTPGVDGCPVLTTPTCAPLKARICIPATAGWASRYFGGADATVNTDTEVAALLNGVTDTQAGLDGLATDAERTFVNDHGLTPATVQTTSADEPVTTTDQTRSLTGAPEYGDVGGTTPADQTTETADGETVPAAAPVSDSTTETDSLTRATIYSYWRTRTFTCSTKSGAGITLWKYKSRWTWKYTPYYRKVRAASHVEFPSDLFFGWAWHGSTYLWPSGGIGHTYIGRATQGHFAFLWRVALENHPIQDVHVHWDGSAWHRCIKTW